jgi:hypothetical protein
MMSVLLELFIALWQLFYMDAAVTCGFGSVALLCSVFIWCMFRFLVALLVLASSRSATTTIIV